MQEFSPPNVQKFLSDAEERAAYLFSRADKGAKPPVFIVSAAEAEAPAPAEIQQTPPPRAHKFSVFAQKDFWLSEEDFAEFEKVLAKVSAQGAERKLSRRISDLPSSYTSANSQFADMREAIFKLLNASAKKPHGLKFFVSEASIAGGAKRFVALGVDENFLSNTPSLEVSAESETFLSPSFALSLIDEFLEKHRIELDMPPDATEAPLLS